jgi:ABC-type branched-subunit amino acid transport system substrate-binding protein
MKHTLNVRLLSFILVLGLTSGTAKASVQQDSIVFRGDVEREFVEAMRAFTSQRYDSAASLFSSILKEFPRSHRSTGASIMGAKAYYQLGNYRESIRLVKDLMDVYPESQYLDDAHYTLGLDYYRLGRYEDAAGEFLIARQITRRPKLVAISERMLDMLASTQLTVAQLQMMLPVATIDVTKALLNYWIAEKIFRTGDVKNAEAVLQTVTALPPDIKYVVEAGQLLARIQKGGVLKVGVALPLMLKAGPGAPKAGLETLEGVQQAVDDYNKDAIPKVNLEIRDTEGDPSVASRTVAELCSDDAVVAILGPMSSEDVFAAAGVANTRGVPLITPTATRNGIAAVGPYIFQANPDFDMRGRAMARYAFEQRGARHFAVLASQGSVGVPLAEAFIDEVKRLGGEIVDVEWYFPGSTDMRPQLLALRKKALESAEVQIVDFAARMKESALLNMERWGVPSQILDSLVERNASAPVTFLFGKNGKQIADSLGIPIVVLPPKFDSLAIPVDNIDALFVPIATSDEIGVVTSQIKYYNFKTLLLGTEDWNELSELDENRQYSDGAIFSTDTYTNTESPAYRAFNATYQKAHGKKPAKNTMLGYDTMELLLQTVRNGARQRNDIAAGLPAIKGYAGLHSTISFTDKRVNSFLTILQFKNRTISKIGEIDLSSPPVSPEIK